MFLNAGKDVKSSYLVVLATSIVGFLLFIIIRCAGKFGNINPPEGGFLHSDTVPTGNKKHVFLVIK